MYGVGQGKDQEEVELKERPGKSKLEEPSDFGGEPSSSGVNEPQPKPKNADKNTSFPKDIPDLARAHTLLGLVGEVTNQNIADRCREIITNLKEMLKPIVTTSSIEAYSKLRKVLEGPLPVPTNSIDFTSKESIDKAVNNMLQEMLGIKDLAQGQSLDDAVKGELRKNGIIDDVSVAAVKNFIKMRVLLDIRNREGLEELEEEKKLEKYVEAMAKYAAQVHEIALFGHSNELPSAISAGKKLTAEQLKEMTEEKTAKQIADGVYATFDKNGKLFLALTQFDERSIKATVAALKNSSNIVWHNIPADKKHLAEIECLKQGKRCIFNDHGQRTEGLLSQTMPKPPKGANDWAEWVKNIQVLPAPHGSQNWQKTKDKVLHNLLRYVIGEEDPKKLAEFWSDIVKHKDAGDMPQLYEITKYFIPSQLETLGSNLLTIVNVPVPVPTSRGKERATDEISQRFQDIQLNAAKKEKATLYGVYQDTTTTDQEGSKKDKKQIEEQETKKIRYANFLVADIKDLNKKGLLSTPVGEKAINDYVKLLADSPRPFSMGLLDEYLKSQGMLTSPSDERARAQIINQYLLEKIKKALPQQQAPQQASQAVPPQQQVQQAAPPQQQSQQQLPQAAQQQQQVPLALPQEEQSSQLKGAIAEYKKFIEDKTYKKNSDDLLGIAETQISGIGGAVKPSQEHTGEAFALK